MDETICVIFKVQFDFALEVWFSIVSYASGSAPLSKMTAILKNFK